LPPETAETEDHSFSGSLDGTASPSPIGAADSSFSGAAAPAWMTVPQRPQGNKAAKNKVKQERNGEAQDQELAKAFKRKADATLEIAQVEKERLALDRERMEMEIFLAKVDEDTNPLAAQFFAKKRRLILDRMEKDDPGAGAKESEEE
jgi:hypothetical protein